MKQKVDIVRPETWVRYKPSMCEGCHSGCCTLPVTCTAEDLFHMGYLEMHQVNGPLVRIANRLKKEGLIRSFNRRTRIFTLRQLPNHDCQFLDENRRCKIYDRRPSICRRFPFNSARPGYCPSQRESSYRE